MPNLPQRKVGIVACSGEELAEGTVTRLAALKVLEELRPAQTVTICLPLFLAGGEGDRAFAKFYPTIAVDGCEKRCAARATELYSNKPAASLLVGEVLARHGLPPPQGVRRLTPESRAGVDALAAEIAAEVDHLIAVRWSRTEGAILEETATASAVSTSACACGSGIPVTTVDRRRADDPDHGARTDPGVGATARGCAPGRICRSRSWPRCGSTTRSRRAKRRGGRRRSTWPGGPSATTRPCRHPQRIRGSSHGEHSHLHDRGRLERRAPGSSRDGQRAGDGFLRAARRARPSPAC